MKHIFTINEFGAFVELGYRIGIHAPGLKLPPGRFNQTRHHAVLGHGLAVQAIRASGKPGTKVGLAENMTICVPVIETAEHIDAAERATREMNAQYMTVIQEGKYTDAYLARMPAPTRRSSRAEDLKIISSPLDFVGINIYTPIYVRADDSPQRLRGRAAPAVVSAHGVAVAVHRARGALLGTAPRREDLEREGDLHHRERLLVVGCAGRGRHGVRHRPRDVSAQLSDAAPARDVPTACR